MGTSQRIRNDDLRAMLRLAGEAGELPPGSDERRSHLLTGVCRLVRGAGATTFILGRDVGRGGRLMDPHGLFLPPHRATDDAAFARS